MWVRGYGLVDSPKVKSRAGTLVNLTAVIAPNAAAAAEYYPAIYWFAMLKIPDKSLFPGTGLEGNGMPVAFKSQEQWLNVVQLNGCGNCHQLGDKATREIPAALGTFDNSSEAWARRLQSGPAGTTMVRTIGTLNTPDGGHLRRLAEWTDRIKAGELPASVPPRPHGVERNLVVTVYDWLSTQALPPRPDRHRPAEAHGQRLRPDLRRGRAEHGSPADPGPGQDHQDHHESADPRSGRSQLGAGQPGGGAVAVLRSEQVWDTRVNAHNPMMDQDGRVYYTAQIRSPKNPPAYCAAASGHPSAKVYPLTGTPDGFVQNSRQVTVYDPKTRQFTFIDTCFGTHHLNFAEDANNTLWLSNNPRTSSPSSAGSTRRCSGRPATPAPSQGWTPIIVDTNGNGSATPM